MVPATTPPPLVIELRGLVGRSLPDYMAPAAYVMLDTLPKTANGKVDRLALPRPEALGREVANAFAAPGNATEQAVAAVWRECLGVDAVGIDDNFFDLGGHSLLLVRVHDRLREALKVELSLVDLFRFPTVRALAATLSAKQSGTAETGPASLNRADQRAALQRAARSNRKHRSGGEKHG